MKEYYGRCHCGNINFAFQSEESVEIWKCNCSICCLYDYEHLFIKHEEFSLIKGKTKISSYSFGTKSAAHLFCKVCGIKSFYQPRSHPDMYSVNLKCVKNPPKVKKLIHFNGINFEESIDKT
jgi:hypothetical protein